MNPSTLQGADAIHFLDDHGWPGFGLPRYGKKGYSKGWNTYGQGKSAQEAIRHYNSGKMVSVFTDGRHTILDRDFFWRESLDSLGEYAHTTKIQRSNAPDRGALLYEVIDADITSQNYKPEGSKEPYAELLAIAQSGNHKAKAIAGVYEGGVYQLVDTHYGIKRITRAEYDKIWQILTGLHLDERRKRTDRPQGSHRRSPQGNNGLLEQVKAHYSAYSVFERFGWTNDVSKAAGDGYKLHGHGGLYVGDPDNPNERHQWFCHSNDGGGDQIDAWHYCQHGRILDRGDSSAFVETLHEMATAAGIDIPKASGVIDPDQVRAEIPQIRDWVKSTSFADYVPQELQSSVGYRTDSTDTKVADAVLDIAEERGTFRVYTSRRTLAQRAGLGDHKTAQKALERLAGWFVTLHEDGCIEVARRFPTSTSLKQPEELMGNLRATYSERKNDDPFLSGVSRTVRKRVQKSAVRIKQIAIEEGGMSAEDAAKINFDRELLKETEPGLGETILRVIDAIEIHGAADRDELVDVTGKTPSAIARATLRAEKLGILDYEQEHRRAPKVYDLAENWRERIEILRPVLKTYKLGLEREKRNCEALISYCEREMKRAEGEDLCKVARRKGKAEKRLAEILPQLHEWMTPEDVDRWLSTPNGKQAERPHSMDRSHEDFMMDVRLYQQRKEREFLDQIRRDLADGWEHLAYYAERAGTYV